MRKVSINQRVYQVPETWNEMTKLQAIVCSRAVVEFMRLHATIKNETLLEARKADVRVRLMPYLLGVNQYRWQRIRKHTDPTELATLMLLADVVFADYRMTDAYLQLNHRMHPDDYQDKVDAIQRKLLLTKQHLHQFRWSAYLGDMYYGPDSNFANMTIDELRYADNFFMKAQVDANDDYIDALIAVMYRKASKQAEKNNADKREVFDEFTVISRAKKLKKLPVGLKYYIFMWYKSNRAALELRYPYVFKRDGKKPAPGQPKGFGPIILATSGAKFGTYDQTKNVLAHVFLLSLNEDMRNAEEQNRKQKTTA